MLLAPPTPTHTHEDRLSHSRAVSPPVSSNSPPSPVHSNKRRTSSPSSRPIPMNEVSSHFTPTTTSTPHTPTQGRSPQSSLTPTSAASERAASSSLGMGVPPSSQPMAPITTTSAALSALSSGGIGGAAPIVPVTGNVGGGPTQTPPLHHPLLGYVPHGNKILSRNLNGTLAVTNQPNNESELQLYRVLQRANLLSYYDTFISQGGDDVQQLCEAGEEEFLEIMALVGMASKPLHVRRLQKALQEWVSNPPLFQIPLLPNLPSSVVSGFPFPHRGIMGNSTPTPPTRPSPPMTSSSSMIHNHSSSPGKDGSMHTSNSLGGSSPRDGISSNNPMCRDVGMIPLGGSRGPSPGINQALHMNSSSGHMTPGSLSLQNCPSSVGPDKNPEFFIQMMKNAGCESPGLSYPPSCGSPLGGSPVGGNSPQGNTPSLHEAQIARLAQAASELVANLPSLEPRKDAFANKRKMSKELEGSCARRTELIMNMSDDDPRRMEEIRKYAAIYGRFDCKRKPEKPLTLHEVSVNEAAAQICKYMPALLTRRDELFPLARQVVRDSGYQYSKGHSRSQTVIGREEEQRNKKPRLDSSQDQDTQWKKRQERLEAISDELRAMSDKAEDVRNSLTSGTGNIADLTQQMDAIHTRHAQLTMEQSELLKAQQKSYTTRPRSERTCSEETRGTDDSDSQFSYSATNSPSQVLSSSQGNIIAVANPALSMSSAMTPNHAVNLHDEDQRHMNPIYAAVSHNHSCSNRTNSSSIKQEPNSPGNPKQD